MLKVSARLLGSVSPTMWLLSLVPLYSAIAFPPQAVALLSYRTLTGGCRHAANARLTRRNRAANFFSGLKNFLLRDQQQAVTVGRSLLPKSANSSYSAGCSAASRYSFHLARSDSDVSRLPSGDQPGGART